MWDRCSPTMGQSRSAQCCAIHRVRARAAPLLHSQQNNPPLVLSRYERLFTSATWQFDDSDLSPALSRLFIKVRRWRDAQRRWSWSSPTRRRRKTPSVFSRCSRTCGTLRLASTVPSHRRLFLSHRPFIRIRLHTLVRTWHRNHFQPRHCSCSSTSSRLDCTSSCFMVREINLRETFLLPLACTRRQRRHTDALCFLGLGGQTEVQTQQSAAAGLSAAAAAGLLGPISVQNLLTLAAMTQPQLTGTTASQQSPMHNGAAASLCKFNCFQSIMSAGVWLCVSFFYSSFLQGLGLMHWPHNWLQRPRHHRRRLRYHNSHHRSPRRLSPTPRWHKPLLRPPGSKWKDPKAVTCSSIISHKNSRTPIWLRPSCPSDTWCRQRSSSTSRRIWVNVSASCRSTTSRRLRPPFRRCTGSKSARSA